MLSGSISILPSFVLLQEILVIFSTGFLASQVLTTTFTHLSV